jgi:hypothetical protein
MAYEYGGVSGQAGNCWLKYVLNPSSIAKGVPQISALLDECHEC